MELFLKSELEFEKVSMGTDLPEDPNMWPQAILQQLFKEVPYLSDFSPNISMDKADSEKGYGFGHVTVMNQTEIQQGTDPASAASAGIRQVRIPIIIKDSQLMPLDLLITDDAKVYPLTEPRLRAAVFRPQAFDVTARTPGDQSMIGALFPPYRQNYGFAGGGVSTDVGMGKSSSALEEYLEKDAGVGSSVEKAVRGVAHGAGGEMARGAGAAIKDFAVANKEKLIGGAAAATGAKVLYDKHRDKRVAQNIVSELNKGASVLDAISGTLNASDVDMFKSALANNNLMMAYTENAAATYPSVRSILESGERTKVAFSELVTPDVAQLVRVASGYMVKEANHNYWEPTIRFLDRGAALQEFGSKIVLAADMSGAVTAAEGATAQETPAEEEVEQPSSISSYGHYRVQTDDGKELIGCVIPHLIDTNGTKIPISLFTNGTQAAVQEDIMGIPVESDGAGLPVSAPGGYGAFFAEEDGTTVATVPMELSGSFTQGPGQPTIFQGTTFDGRHVEVSQQPNIQSVIGSEERLLIPQSWRWTPLDKAGEVSLVGSQDALPKQASARRFLGSVELVSGGETFSVRGPAVEKLASDQREFLDTDAAMFLLAGLGVDQEYGIRKMAESMLGAGPVSVVIGRTIKMASDRTKEASSHAADFMKSYPDLRTYLFKEAAVITDPEAVDTVLSIGFINPENITTFISYMPVLEGAQTKLCELLVASRLGLSDVPESALEKSIRATESVLEGLKTLSFEAPAQYN